MSSLDIPFRKCGKSIPFSGEQVFVDKKCLIFAREILRAFFFLHYYLQSLI